MESFRSRQRRVKRFHSEPRQGRFGFVQGEEVPAWWDNVQARLVMHRQPKLTSRERIRLIISGVRAGT